MSTNPVPSSTFYADPASLGSLKLSAKAENPAALREAARQFESLFTQMMLKSMREANFGDSLAGSDATDFYQEMHDSQLAVEISKGRGLGLADMLVQQLTKAGGKALGDPVVGVSAAGQGLRGRSLGVDPAAVAGVAAPGANRTASPAIDAWPPATREEFVRQLKPYAEMAGRDLGVDPDTLLAHAALETGWGKSIPNGADGACSFNLFGIKAGSRWPGATVGVSTIEFEAGMATRKVERFRSYDSPADCFKDYAALLGNSDRYSDAKGAGADAAAFGKALHRGGYATDPDYARKLTAVAESLKNLLKNAGEAPLTAVAGKE
jgi:peptidoglycan hydrolase FlgJ